MQEEPFVIPPYAPIVGAVYGHYKHKDHQYRVTGISLNSDSNEWHIEYVPLYEGAVANRFNRSLANWMNKATVDGVEVERYPLISAD